MSDIAAHARAAASHMEVKKDGLRQTQDGQWKITLTALELPPWLITARPGTRIMAALVEIGDDETPVSHTSPAPAARIGESAASGGTTTGAAPGRDAAKSERGKAAFAALPDMKKDVVKAAMMVKDAMFQGWLLSPQIVRDTTPDQCAKLANLELRICLRIQSKAEIGEDPAANERWNKLLTTYLADTNQLAEVRG